MSLTVLILHHRFEHHIIMPPFTIAALEPDFVIDLLYPVAIIESYHDFRIIYVIYELSELRRDIALGARSINKYPLSAVTKLFVVPQIQHLETINILSFIKEIEPAYEDLK